MGRNVSFIGLSRRTLRPSYVEGPVTETRRPSVDRLIEYHLAHRPSRQSCVDGASVVNQQPPNVRISRHLLPHEILTLDSVRFGLSIRGSVTLWRLLLPLERANYPFNVHERRKPFIPGDAVSVQMGQASMKIFFARTEDIVPPSTGKLSKTSVLNVVNNEVIGEVKYTYVYRIESAALTTGAQPFMIRLSGAVGFMLQLCFGDRSLCSAFVKLLMPHCPGHTTIAAEADVFSSPPSFSTFENQQHSLSPAPLNRFSAG
ncbi:putative mucin-associated surface protein (MASP) [Trypanosoma rangeli]|uniref:Putative mucin-associated surface protein (MASP) n=1 Tax=Trypanosoma rangeli TaxID=5698 RepID=A0A3R7KS94_TRYRA|nr:putative mucin-associated surface protein (MASP) [Trypanosoma rangeli]RNF12535.1 putative mucin-associated surface protein (MASP) [Trypanosoma rangeli]|eukprot:RNF12535.1 putative mucin-associated surface protein (MASP) [Trypanosoma rangeli]